MTDFNRELAGCLRAEFKLALGRHWRTFIVPEIRHERLRKCSVLAFEYRSFGVPFRLVTHAGVTLELNTQCFLNHLTGKIPIPLWAGYKLAGRAAPFDDYPTSHLPNGGRYRAGVDFDLSDPGTIDALSDEVMRAVSYVQEAI